jgi:large subunit ribosomal protein L21
MKAIILTGGKQYTVEENSEIYVEKLKVEPGEKIIFDKVLMLNNQIGNPYLDGVTVTGKIVKHGKQKKIRIFKYVNKNKSTRNSQGHRQPYTKVEITKIG